MNIMEIKPGSTTGSACPPPHTARAAVPYENHHTMKSLENQPFIASGLRTAFLCAVFLIQRRSAGNPGASAHTVRQSRPVRLRIRPQKIEYPLKELSRDYDSTTPACSVPKKIPARSGFPDADFRVFRRKRLTLGGGAGKMSYHPHHNLIIVVFLKKMREGVQNV